jgi:sulfoxide reductase heme-binding subunit YedZ
VTPFRRILRAGNLIDVRRMLGVGSFCYIAAHLALFFADQSYSFGKVIHEITHRVYLIVGAVAWLGLAVLAATSTDGMVRRLGGRRWQKLHQLIYVIVLLALIHFFQQTKLNIWWPTLIAGLVGWLLGYRIMVRGRSGEPSALMLLGLTVAVTALTFICEAIGIAIGFNTSPWLVLQMAFDVDLETFDIRPGWLVLAAGLAVVVLDVVRSRLRKPRARTPVAAKPMREPA